MVHPAAQSRQAFQHHRRALKDGLDDVTQQVPMRGIGTVSQTICVTGLKFFLRLTIGELSRCIAAMEYHEVFLLSQGRLVPM
jgi:hypothetical protein